MVSEKHSDGKVKVLVTGGAGYIGSVLVAELLKKGYQVSVVDSFMYGQNSLTGLCSNPDLEIIRGDVRDLELMKEIVKDKDFVLPLACLVGVPACAKDKIAAESTNFWAIQNMCSKLDGLSPKTKIIFANTNSGYGVGQGNIYCTEETPLKPISFYGRLKCKAEDSVMERGNAVSLRLATVFGTSPRMRLDLLVNDMVYRAVRDRFVVLYEAHFKRNYIHIYDVARAFVYVMQHWDKMKDEVYNVGLSDANLSKMELCLEIEKQIPDLQIIENEFGKDPDKRNYIVSNEKIEKAGWKPTKALQDGISELIKAYQMPINERMRNA